jgi:hypothetical protein
MTISVYFLVDANSPCLFFFFPYTFSYYIYIYIYIYIFEGMKGYIYNFLKINK